MNTETDPLLPRYPGAPEIDNGRKLRTRDATSHGEDATRTGEDDKTSSSIEIPTMKGFIAVFSSVMFVALLAAFFASRNQAPEPRKPREDLSIRGRVIKILSENPLIDGHNDFAFLIRYLYQNKINGPSFTDAFEKKGMPYHVDLPRIKSGMMGGAFWSAFVPCPENITDFSDENYAIPVSQTLSQLDLLHRLTSKYPDVFSPPSNGSTHANATFTKNSLLISPFAIEGLHQIGNSISNLRLFHTLNVKYATLTHNCHNAYADAALITNTSGAIIAAPPHWNGVSQRGKELVREMNRLGMLVDLAHVSKNTMLDVLGANNWGGSEAPVIFSHSSAYTICPHPRNVPDDVLHLVKERKSLVMVNFSPDFISCVPSNASSGLPDLYAPTVTLHQVARHIIYIGNTIGFDHVGIGSDFDGIPATPRGLEDVSKFPDLVAELLTMGVSDEDAAKIIGRNLLRVWSEVDEVALRLQREGIKPLEDDIERPKI